MPISLFSPTGASLVDGQPRKTLTDQAMPGDMLIVCECPELSPQRGRRERRPVPTPGGYRSTSAALA